MVSPVMYEASSDERNTATPATSDGWPNLSKKQKVFKKSHLTHRFENQAKDYNNTQL